MNWEHRIWFLVVFILIAWGIRDTLRIAPEVRSTANQVANLNQLHDLDIKGKIGGCIPVDINGTV